MNRLARTLIAALYGRLAGNSRTGRSQIADLLLVDAAAFGHAAILSVYLSASVLGGSIFFEQVNDRVLPHKSIETMYILFGVLVAILLVVAFIQKIRASIFECIANKIYSGLNKKIFAAYFSKSDATAEGFFSVYNDVNFIREFMNSRAFSALYDAIAIPIYMFMFFEMHLYLGVVAFSMLIVVSCIAYYQAKTRYKYGLFIRLVLQETRQKSAEIFQQAKSIRSMGMKNAMWLKWSTLYLDNAKAAQVVEDENVNVDILSKFLLSSVAGIMLATGLLLVLTGEMGPGNAIGCMLIAGKLFQPFTVLTMDWPEFLKVADSCRRLDAVLAAPSVHIDSSPDEAVPGQPRSRGFVLAAGE